jgi:hypothetical protein
MAISNLGIEAGLKAAGEVLVKAIKAKAAAMPSKKIPGTVKSYVRGGVGYINAGGPGGRTAPNAYMFETYGARHPLFAHGPRGTDGWKNWYDQPYRPFMEEGVEASLNEAAETFADTAIEVMAAEGGYDVK